MHRESAEQQLQAFEKQACLKNARYILQKKEGKIEQQE